MILNDSLPHVLNYHMHLHFTFVQLLSKDFESPPKSEMITKQPLVIDYQDEISQRLNHLQPVDGFDPVQAELNMLGYSPVADLVNVMPPADLPAMVQRQARLQQLLSSCLSHADLNEAGMNYSVK